MKNRTNWVEGVLVAGLALIVLSVLHAYSWWKEREATKEAMRIEAQPPLYGQWTDQMLADPIRTMGKAGFSGKWGGCGVMRFKVDFNHPGRYLVRCSAVGEYWNEYRVDVVKGTVAGPFTPSPENN